MRILVFGGSGTLGTALKKLDDSIICPSKADFNIIHRGDVHTAFYLFRPDLVINCAAIIDDRVINEEPSDAIAVNIVGSGHIARECSERIIRYVYISTDYVYPGDRGKYKESDLIYPCNKYAWSKLGGECSAMMLDNSLVIRTSFGKKKFDYKKAFIDKWTSKDYVDVIAPMILDASKSNLTGILNIGTKRKTMYDYAIQRNQVEPMCVEESGINTPKDSSLNLSRWERFKKSI
jgi:dTDP-4-dehydrorhamnose reductase